MPRRVKEEEKIEMIIRGLLKLPENRRCINCNSLGPQYVCTTFWTFVCTSCSGVHREFTHRVKSVSMAKFNEEEIMALQAGGNERAKEIYFKTWDPQRNCQPDSSNLHRLREFVKHVYIDRKYAGQNSSNKISMIKLDSRNESLERRSFEKSSWGAKDEFFGRSSFERTSNSSRDDKSSRNNELTIKDFLEERSPRWNQETMRSSSHRNRSARFEIVDDRFRDDGSVKRYERHSDKESKVGSKLATSLPAIRPVKDILGEKGPELTIGGPPKDGKDAEGSARCQKAADGTIPEPTGGEEKQYKTVNVSSLIDFDATPEPTDNTAEPQTQPTASKNDKESSSIASSYSNNGPNLNSVESLLFDWSAPVSSPSAATSQTSGGNIVEALAMTSMKNEQPLHSNSSGPMQVAQVHQLPCEQQNRTFISPASNDLRPVQSVDPGDGTTPSARKELPQDIFASNFTSFTPAVAGWQMHPPQGTVYGMQFHSPTMSAAAFPNPSNPINPFDFGDDRFQVQAATFPSMTPLQGALQNMPASTALESQPSPYATPLSSHVSAYGMHNMPLVPGAYMGQLPNNTPLTRAQGSANFGRNDDAFASINPIQQISGTKSLPAASNSPLSRGGNPFG